MAGLGFREQRKPCEKSLCKPQVPRLHFVCILSGADFSLNQSINHHNLVAARTKGQLVRAAIRGQD